MKSKNTSSGIFASVVCLLSGFSEKEWENELKKLVDYLSFQFEDYELIIVEDTIVSFGKDMLDFGLNQNACVRYLRSSYELGEEDAYELGIRSSIGDFVIIFSVSRDPYDIIYNSINYSIKNKFEIIYGVDKASYKNTLSIRIKHKIHRLVGKIIDYNIPKGTTAFRCLSRKAVLGTLINENKYSQIFLNIHNCGFPIEYLNYETKSQIKNESFFNFLNKNINDLVLNSAKPLRFVSFLGIIGSSLSLVFAAYSFLVHFLKTNVASGWTSTILIMTFLFTLLFIILIFIGEYIGRLLRLNPRNNKLFVADEFHSSIMLNMNRYNISQSSEE